MRGLAFTPYGSDGLVGGLLFNTLEPNDLLHERNKPYYFSLTPSYNSANRSFGSAMQIAGSNDRISALFISNYRRHHEYSSQGKTGGEGPTRTQADPLNGYSKAMLAKLVATINADHQIVLTGERHEQTNCSDILSARNPARNITQLISNDNFD